jgi:putative ABC transport system ATP-binding protein
MTTVGREADGVGHAQLGLRGVGRAFGPEPGVQALRDVNVDVGAGEAVAVIGRSGSGKSTLLNLLGLLDSPTSGNYQIEGTRVEHLPESARTRLRATFFGFVFQQSFLLGNRTAQENVEIPLYLQPNSWRERPRRALEALSSVGLRHRAGFLPRAMSGGECQRVAIARALVHRPRVLLCDEPTGNVDEKTTGEVLQLLLAASDAGMTLIMVTHDLAVARAFPRILSVRDGRVSEGPESFLDSESLTLRGQAGSSAPEGEG